MRKHSFKWTAVLLSLACVCATGGCNQTEDSDLYSDIVISQEKPYSKETEAYAETVIFSVLKYATHKKTGIEPNANIVEKLKGVASNVQKIMASTAIHEDLYLAVMGKVAQRGNAVIDEIFAGKEDDWTENNFTATKALYLDLSSMVGVDYVGGVLYDLCVYLYQYRHDDAMAKYEKYGPSYVYLKLDAEKYMAEQTVLKNGIGKDNFIVALKSGFAFADLLIGEGVQAEQLATFTDTEIVTFVQGLGISSLSITEEGWGLILSNIILNDGGMYAMKCLNLVKEYDLTEGAKAVKCGVELLSSAIQKMTPKDAALLRAGDFFAMLQSAFQHFDEADWALFQRMTDVQLHTEYYEALAVETYGDAYLQYKNTVTVSTLAQLQASVAQDDFYNVLKGYIAGISPAISYGMHHD